MEMYPSVDISENLVVNFFVALSTVVFLFRKSKVFTIMHDQNSTRKVWKEEEGTRPP